MNPTSSRLGGDPLGWRDELRHALGQPALASFSDDAQTEDSEACRAAYQVAACLGKCRLFGVDAGELDGTLPAGLAAAASRQWAAYVGEWIEAAGRLPGAWSESAEEVEALDRAVDLLTARMESWAVFLAVDESYQDSIELALPVGPRLGQAVRFALDVLDRFDRVLRDNAAYLAPVAGTELLNNWRSLLTPAYGRTLPWWLDGGLDDLWRKIREDPVAWLPGSSPRRTHLGTTPRSSGSTGEAKRRLQPEQQETSRDKGYEPEPPSPKKVTSPFSTGGGGEDLQAQVGAYYLAGLLLRHLPRGLEAGILSEVRFQRLYEGEPVDDLVCVADNATGQSKLALQIKNDLTFGEKDEKFEEVMAACWRTYTSPNFNRDRDRFAIALGVYQTKIDEHYQTVLTWARSSSSTATFFDRIGREGFSHKNHREFVTLVRSKLTVAQGGAISDNDLWGFLRSLVILHFDLLAGGSRDAAHIVNGLRQVLQPGPGPGAEDLFSRLRGISAEANRTAGEYNRDSLTKRLLAEGFRLVPSQSRRRDFLGPPAVGAFLPPQEYFRPFLDAERLFHHGLPLVGRQALLDDLVAFADSPRERILVLPGRGGIGKSRLLREWAERVEATHPDRAVRLLNEGIQVSPDALDDLPPVPCLVAVDDAHRRPDLGFLLAWARQRPESKLLFATRLQGLDFLLAELTRAGFDSRQIRRLPPVEKLSKAEVRQLAAHVLGPDSSDLVEPLVRATRDCPLVTVVGGRLLAIRSVHPELLERDGDFRQEVLTRFTDESLGQVSRNVPADLARRVLQLVAALAPVPADPGPFHDRVAAFLRADTLDVTQALGELERVGLLVRRGRSLRVVPDVLADHVVASACLTPQGAATGFADRVFAEFARDCLSQLLRNLAELDWRVRLDSGTDSPLLDRVWRQITEGFRSGGHRVRAEVLGQLEESAYFLPGRVLELVRFALRNPAPGGPEEVMPGYFSYTHDNVVHAVPDLLLRCAYSPECLPACLDLLWELDRGDERATNTHPEHPFRIITDIAGYRPDKPLWVNQAAADAARRWLSRPDAWDGPRTPLDVLDTLLEKSGIEYVADGHALRLCAFHLDYESVRQLREGVIDTLGSCLRSGDPRAVLRAVRSLGKALNGPLPYLGMAVTADDLRQWEPEQLRILGMLNCLVGGGPPPVVSLAVLREVRHQARDGYLEAVREAAASLVRAIGQTFEFRLTRMLLPDMSRWDLFEEEGGEDLVAESEQRRQALARSVANEFWSRFPDPAAAVAEIDLRLREIQPLEPKCDATGLCWSLIEARPETVLPFARQLLAVPDSPVSLCLRVVLVHLHRRDSAAFAGFASDALDTGALVFRHAMAHYFGWDVPRETPLQEWEVELVRRLLADPDPGVRAAAVHGLRRVAASRPRDAIDLARGVDPGEGAGIVKELCHLADPHWEGIPDAFTDGDIVSFLERIEGVDDLNDHGITEFLRFACGRLPHAVIDMFFRRIERQGREDYRSGYRPVPFHAFHDTFSVLAGTDMQREVLRRIRDHSLGMEGLVLRSLADLYHDASQQFGPAGIDVLAEWLLGGNQQQMETAACLLEHAPSSFVFDQLELVSRALDRAEALGGGCCRRVGFAFYRIAMSGMRSRTTGEPYPQDIALRDRCQAVLPTLAAGSPIHGLVRDVLERAERNIREATQEDDEDD
jgi:hypothetical protein